MYYGLARTRYNTLYRLAALEMECRQWGIDYQEIYDKAKELSTTTHHTFLDAFRILLDEEKKGRS